VREEVERHRFLCRVGNHAAMLYGIHSISSLDNFVCETQHFLLKPKNFNSSFRLHLPHVVLLGLIFRGDCDFQQQVDLTGA
jgi:hypothetical protein